MKKNDKIDENEKRRDEREIEKNEEKKMKKIRRERDETRAKINIFRYFDVNSFRFHFH